MYNFIIILPFLSAIIICILGNRWSCIPSYIISIICNFFSMIISWIAFYKITILKIKISGLTFQWFNSGSFYALWGFNYDTLTCVMFVIITTVSLMIHIYTIGFLSTQLSKSRLITLLSFFTFSMLLLVSSNNLIQLLFSWELISILSYFLLSFHYNNEKSLQASYKIFIINKFGDLFFIVGIIFIISYFETTELNKIFVLTPSLTEYKLKLLTYEINLIEIICLCLFLGTLCKCAQFLFFSVINKTIEGPISVTALIHSLTLVIVSIFVICKLSPLFEFAPHILNFIKIIGSISALSGSILAIVQYDVKRIIAFSTFSQIGLMFLSIGLSSYPMALFHLITHSFGKSLIFLGIGNLIYNLSGEQDVRKMGGIYKKLPISYIFIWIASFSLSGVPFFSGYYSTNAIAEITYSSNSHLMDFTFLCTFATIFFTSIYSWRLIFLTFHGEYKGIKIYYDKINENSFFMLFPMYILCFGVVFSGWVSYEVFVGESSTYFWEESLTILTKNEVLINSYFVPNWLKSLSTFLTLIGISITTVCYVLIPDLPKLNLVFLNKLNVYNLHIKHYTDNILFLILSIFRISEKFVISKTNDDRLNAFDFKIIKNSITPILKFNSKIEVKYSFNYAIILFVGIILLILIFLPKFNNF